MISTGSSARGPAAALALASCIFAYAVLTGCTSLGTSTQGGIPSGLRTDCVSAAVVGLRWGPTTGRVRAAQYEIKRDGVTLGTTSESLFADSTVAPLTHYTYSVNDQVTLEVNTPAASPTGDAPYCPSPYIESMSWDWAHGYTEPNGSDLWPVTWGKDGHVYTFFGDGGGFGGDNHRGRASFGIATITAPPPVTNSSAHNIYGGHNSPHPSLLEGKAGSIIAVGPDFYTLGGIYTASEAAGHQGLRSGAPSRIQLAYSKGNAHSWQVAPWTFCGADRQQLQGHFCPRGFINFGRGNSGAIDSHVYLIGFVNSSGYWNGGAEETVAATYLARVPGKRVLESDAYRYFAGLDPRGRPIWSADQSRIQPIFTDRNPSRPGCSGRCNMAAPLEEAVYNPAIKRYIAVAQGGYVGQTSFYDAPHLWGPWTTISYNNIDPTTGTGGWANLGTAGGFSLGVHVVNAWTSRDGLNLWVTYSSDGTAPPGGLFPPEGTMMDSFNLLSVRLTPRAANIGSNGN